MTAAVGACCRAGAAVFVLKIQNDIIEVFRDRFSQVFRLVIFSKDFDCHLFLVLVAYTKVGRWVVHGDVHFA